MFGSNTKKLLEETSKQMDKLNETLERFVEMKGWEMQHNPDSNSFPLSSKINSKSPIQAAYALNLCSVSISQIVDYNDLNILEQEYDAILNNLNLQHFPKDEALLKILKQILDTVTFFRIQEGDKQFVERDYQQKMKNAIWSAVSNVGLVVASGNPYVMLMSLATQVGTGYMNYRKQKADNTLEYEKAKWQLQRAAIEQFNGLRRELFDTAWRLADKYNFPDEYRLTERQIHQYNEILMDSDIYRRFERLDAIKSYFEAYPPFWYYLGRTAATIAKEPDTPSVISRKYSDIAIKSFKKYLEVNHSELLRIDTVAASCCLELAGLLPPDKDKKEIISLLGIAAKNAGNHNDIIQLCANGYLAMGEIQLAEKYLRSLVLEGFNQISNAQIISSIYCMNIIDSNNLDALDKYNLLSRYVNPYYLMPIPPDDDLQKYKNKEIKKKVSDTFLGNQRGILNKKYKLVFDALVNKFTVKLNRRYQSFCGQKDDKYYSDNKDCIYQRKVDADNHFISKKQINEYNRNISSYCYEYDILSYLNEFINACSYIKDFELKFDKIDEQLKNAIDKIRTIDNAIQNSSCDNTTISALMDLSFNTFTSSFRHDFISKMDEYVSSLNTIAEINSAENQLIEICIAENLPSPDELYLETLNEPIDNNQCPKFILSSESEFFNSVSDRERIKKAKALFETYATEINNDKYKLINDIDFIDSFQSQYYSDISKFADLSTAFRRKKVVAILKSEKNGISNDILYFTPDFVFKIESSWFRDELLKCPYKDIVSDGYGNLIYEGKTLIKSEVAKTEKLFQLMREIN